MNPVGRRFHAEIKPEERGGAYIVVPEEIVEAFGIRGGEPARLLLDGEPYRGSIDPRGDRHVIRVTRAIQEVLGKTVGDSIHVIVEETGS